MPATRRPSWRSWRVIAGGCSPSPFAICAITPTPRRSPRTRSSAPTAGWRVSAAIHRSPAGCIASPSISRATAIGIRPAAIAATPARLTARSAATATRRSRISSPATCRIPRGRPRIASSSRRSPHASRRLKEPQRDILTLRSLLDHSYGEIAEDLHINPGTVKSRLARARKSLRRLLAESDAEFEPASSPAHPWMESSRATGFTRLKSRPAVGEDPIP